MVATGLKHGLGGPCSWAGLTVDSSAVLTRRGRLGSTFYFVNSALMIVQRKRELKLKYSLLFTFMERKGVTIITSLKTASETEEKSSPWTRDGAEKGFSEVGLCEGEDS